MATETDESKDVQDDRTDAVEPFILCKVSNVKTEHLYNESRQTVVKTTTCTITTEWVAVGVSFNA